MKNLPLVSAIITTRNEEEVLENLLTSLQKQTYKNLEIIIVDNNSSDRTKEIAQKYTRQVFNKGPERSVQRNFGVSISNGEYLLFLDADMELMPEVIKDCLELFRKSLKSKLSLGGVIIPEESFGIGYWAQVKAFERSFYVGDDTVESARFYLARAFKEVKGFDEELLGFEDLDLTERVREKYQIGRIKSYIRHNEKRPTLLGMARKSSYYAKKTGLLLSKKKLSPFTPKTIYFLRPSFYRNWRRLVSHPALTMSMILMLSLQLSFGAFSYLKNRRR